MITVLGEHDRFPEQDWDGVDCISIWACADSVKEIVDDARRKGYDVNVESVLVNVKLNLYPLA